jgi:hypothetical protein
MLNQLREKGEATFTIPEILFNIDHPGYYDRRIRSVQVTIPCVAGPYAPVTGTLTLNSSKRRKKPKLDIAPDEDPQTGASIALSSSRSDSGLFELTSQDPLYLPFEGMGAESTWTLQLPTTVKNFDYWSIADVILTVQYTAKRGSDQFRKDVSEKLKEALNAVTTAPPGNRVGPYQLISVRHDLPDIWHRFKAGQGLSVALSVDMLSFMLKSLNPTLKEVAGKIRMDGDSSSPVLPFQPPQGESPRWTLPLADNPPDVLQTPDKIEDITLFARYELS